MNFCEKCNQITEEDFCSNCGNKKLREVCDDDFCFLTELEKAEAYSLINSLQQYDIDYSALPYGDGTRTALGLQLENLKIYVPYKSLDTALEILNDTENFSNDLFKKILTDNLDSLNINEKVEKKLRKKLKLSEDIDFIEYCKTIISSSKKVIDQGIIGNCTKFGHYFFAYTDSEEICVNSMTFEILSVRIYKK